MHSVALAEKSKCQVEVFWQAEPASLRFAPQFIVQSKQVRASFAIEIDSYEQTQRLLLYFTRTSSAFITNPISCFIRANTPDQPGVF